MSWWFSQQPPSPGEPSEIPPFRFYGEDSHVYTADDLMEPVLRPLLMLLDAQPLREWYDMCKRGDYSWL